MKSIIVAVTIMVLVVLVLQTIRLVKRNVEWDEVGEEIVSKIEQNIKDKDYESANRYLDEYRDINDDVLIDLGREVKRGEAEENAKGKEDRLEILKKNISRKLEGDVTYSIIEVKYLNVTEKGVSNSPSIKELSKLGLSSFVKLVFDVSNAKKTRREKLWVMITGIDKEGFKGLVESSPETTEVIKKGDEVRFKLNHILDIYKSDNK